MKKYNNVETVGNGLQCDNPQCDFMDTSIDLEKLKDFINAPCPKCGENLLTEEDYQNAQQLQQIYRLINMFSPEELENIAKELGLPECEDLPEGKMQVITVDTHKEIKITDIKTIDKD